MLPFSRPGVTPGIIKVYQLPSIAGLVAWRDYIPVVYRV